ncbi:MAG: hypothetical protein F6K32_05970 [Desertifilum sp. SIO1I2]|nr:hypothetical protein [Desertifilum sp. SIO1I2]
MKHANLVRMFLFATASAFALGANFVPLSTAQEQPQPQPQPTVQPSPTPQPPQRTVFLLSNPCVSAGTGRTIRERQDISIGRQFYTSVMSMVSWSSAYPASVTCRINTTGAAEVQLQFGVIDRDANRPRSRVSVYLDGNEIATRNVIPGEIVTINADITNGSNLAVETLCLSSQNCARVHFINAQLEGAVSTARR